MLQRALADTRPPHVHTNRILRSTPPALPGYNSFMTAEALDRELNREPFVPVRLHLSNGQAVDIHNPGLTFIARMSLYVARTDRPNSRIMDDVQLISLRHIARVELLEPAAN